MGIEKLTYLKLIIALAQETRLYEFPYDWRRLEWNAAILHTSIRLVCRHSRWALCADRSSVWAAAGAHLPALYPEEAERHIERVVMIGSPIYGAPLAGLIFSSETVPAEIVTA